MGLVRTLKFWTFLCRSLIHISPFRIRAVFNDSPWVVPFFAGLWLGAVAGSVTFNFGVNDDVRIGPTRYCFAGQVNHLVLVSAIFPLILNDTLVFIAITWRLYCNSYTRCSFKDSIKVMIFGECLPMFSKALLHDGQVYYLLVLSWVA